MNFELLKNRCETNSQISNRVIDNFLIYYAANSVGIDKEFDRRVRPYKHIIKEFDPEWTDMLKMQYIGHRIFKESGYIHRLLQGEQVKNLTPDDLYFLQQQSKKPWRFSFSTIVKSPAADFYEMEDYLTGETYLLYSESIGKILEVQSPIMWFNLIGFNGECWQSYGPIAHYQSFGPDDIFFFATELQPAIETLEDLADNIELNPVPYMMLLYGSQVPVMQQGGKMAMFIKSYIEVPDLDLKKLEDEFVLQKKRRILKLKAPEVDSYPDFARAYYNAADQEIVLSASTIEGYDYLAAKIERCGIPLPEYYYIYVQPSMFHTTGIILKKKLVFDEYEELFFEEDYLEEEEGDFEDMNKLLDLLIPAINADEKPDYKKLADQTGLDEDIIKEMVAMINDMRFKDMP